MISRSIHTLAAKFLLTKLTGSTFPSPEPLETSLGRADPTQACQTGDLSKLRKILDDGGNPNHTCPDGTTPLHWAAQGGHFDCAKLLLDRGARPLEFSREGRSAWGAAFQAGHRELAWAIRLAESGGKLPAQSSIDESHDAPAINAPKDIIVSAHEAHPVRPCADGKRKKRAFNPKNSAVRPGSTRS